MAGTYDKIDNSLLIHLRRDHMSDKMTFKAQVGKIKLIQANLVHVQLIKQDQDPINALISKKALSFILEVKEGDTISVFGHYNKRKQFIIDKYLNSKALTNQSLDLPGHLSYPSQRRDGHAK